MMIDPAVIQALNTYKRAKKLVGIEYQRVLAMLPDDVASEFHYNGMNAIHRYPEYKEVFEELRGNR
jgi:hypothetical protein